MGRTRYALLLSTALMPLLMGAARRPVPAGILTVEAKGLASMPAGKPLSEARRQALLDARRNAILQARVLVEAQGRVEGMRLKDGLVRVRAFGYVERMEVLQEGPLKGSDPPLYRVRVRAAVRPAAGPGGLPQVHGHPYRPVVALTLSGGAPGLDVKVMRATLLDSLHRCGVVTQGSDAGPALDLKMSLSAGAKPGGSFVTDWELNAGPDDADSPAGLYIGHWEVETGGAERGQWRRVGTIIAQDAVRLWATPRPTTVRFLQPGRAQADALADSFGRCDEAQVKTAGDRSLLSVTLPVAGNPLTAIGAFIKRAGLSGQVELSSASLTKLTYRCRPAQSRAGPERP